MISVGSLVMFKNQEPRNLHRVKWTGLVISIDNTQAVVLWSSGHTWQHSLDKITTERE